MLLHTVAHTHYPIVIQFDYYTKRVGEVEYKLQCSLQFDGKNVDWIRLPLRNVGDRYAAWLEMKTGLIATELDADLIRKMRAEETSDIKWEQIRLDD